MLGYNAERQFAFLTRMGMEDITWRKMALDMLAVVAVLVGMIALLMLRRLRTRIDDPALALYLKFCRKLSKVGLRRAAHEGPLDFAIRAARQRPDLAAAIAVITEHYLALRYGGQTSREGLQALRHEISGFRL